MRAFFSMIFFFHKLLLSLRFACHSIAINIDATAQNRGVEAAAYAVTPDVWRTLGHRLLHHSSTEARKSVAVNREFVRLHKSFFTRRAGPSAAGLLLQSGNLFLQLADQFVQVFVFLRDRRRRRSGWLGG